MSRARAHALALLLGALLGSARGSADERAGAPETQTSEVERCVDAHEHARLSRLREQWIEARSAMSRCADPACPLAIRGDCSAWLEEVERVLPTLLIVIERDDDGETPVELTLDGRALELPSEPGPIEVLPGTHRLRFTLRGYPPAEHEVSVNKGEKYRVVRVRFARAPARLSRPTPAPPARPVPTATYVLAGGAVTAFAVSGLLFGTALYSLSSARESCAPGCPRSERESIEARLLAADLLGGAGVALGGLAVYTFLKRPAVARESALSPELELSRGRVAVSLGGRF